MFAGSAQRFKKTFKHFPKCLKVFWTFEGPAQRFKRFFKHFPKCLKKLLNLCNPAQRFKRFFKHFQKCLKKLLNLCKHLKVFLNILGCFMGLWQNSCLNFFMQLKDHHTLLYTFLVPSCLMELAKEHHVGNQPLPVPVGPHPMTTTTTSNACRGRH